MPFDLGGLLFNLLLGGAELSVHLQPLTTRSRVKALVQVLHALSAAVSPCAARVPFHLSAVEAAEMGHQIVGIRMASAALQPFKRTGLAAIPPVVQACEALLIRAATHRLTAPQLRQVTDDVDRLAHQLEQAWMQRPAPRPPVTPAP